LACNIAEGRGYTTLFIRPFSLYLVQSHHRVGSTNAPTGTDTDFAQIKTAHPDLANPPVYPLVLAGLMKALPFHQPSSLGNTFWSNDGNFWRYKPDFLIAMFNEVLLLVVVVLTFFLGRKLFDASVARLSAILVLGCELLWRFSVSGLSTMLLMLIFLGLTWCILRVEQVAGDSKPEPRRLLYLAITAGLLAGVGALTRYAFGWVIIPVMFFLFFFGGQRRALNTLAALGAFMLVLTPWIVRNFVVSGTPFGTAGFAIVEGMAIFPGFQLERSLHPDLSSALWLTPYVHKLLQNTRAILQDALPRLGGSWASLLFLAGLLLSFRSAAVRRMRYFLLMCVAIFIVVQALGRTQLSEESPEVNSENLLVLFTPLVFIYGVSLFLTLFDQMVLPARELRYLVKIVFVGLCCAPMIFALLPPKTAPVVYPPYYPPDIQRGAGWMERNELMMSDVPWAVAWYGQRQCVWLTFNAQDDFYAINEMKPVQALYLTPKTIDGKLFSDMGLGMENSWGSFIANALVQRQIPGNFPLRYAPYGSAAIGSGIFLTDGERWKTNQK
jgi:hypothetical protein